MALIYIVEDDENIREIETIALKNSNYMVCAFEKATTFYKKLEDIMPDLVLLDVMLPDESGYDIVRKLRKNPATKKLPIIMQDALIYHMRAKLRCLLQLAAVRLLTLLSDVLFQRVTR